jgi:hypothetical protein
LFTASGTPVGILVNSLQLTLKGRYMFFLLNYNKQTNSLALFRERNMPTEQQPLAGEVSANFC